MFLKRFLLPFASDTKIHISFASDGFTTEHKTVKDAMKDGLLNYATIKSAYITNDMLCVTLN